MSKLDGTNCERCGVETDRLYTVGQEDEEYESETGEVRTRRICWNCEHDVCNGGDLFENSWEVLADRAENDYAYDPINNPNPYAGGSSIG